MYIIHGITSSTSRLVSKELEGESGVYPLVNMNVCTALFTTARKWKQPRSPSGNESEVAQSCLALCNPLDYSPPDFSSVHGVFQARKNTMAWQAPPSTGFSRQEYWSGLPFSSPGGFPNPGIKLGSPALQADFSLSHQGILEQTKCAGFFFFNIRMEHYASLGRNDVLTQAPAWMHLEDLCEKGQTQNRYQMIVLTRGV